MMQKAHTIILFSFLSIMLFSCAGNKKSEQKDSLILAIGNEPNEGFDPTTGWGQYNSPLFHSTLLKYDQAFNIIKDAATNYSISEDGLTWIVELRSDILFSDGKPLTAEDVVFTFETAKGNASIVDLSNLKEVIATDSYTVHFTLYQRNTTFIHYLTTLGIVPKHAYNTTYNSNPLGSGPYQMVQWDKGQQLIVKANPYYYGKEPYFKQLVFLFLSRDAAYAAAKAGQVDVVSVTPTLADEQIEGMKLVSLKSIDNRGISLPFLPQGSKVAGRDAGNAVTSDIAIRKAMNIAVDRKLLVDGVLKGHGTPAYSIADQMPWSNPQVNIEKDGDIQKAIEILEQGGWKMGADGIRQKNGVKAMFVLQYPANDHVRQSLAITFADMMSPLGIKIETRDRSWTAIEQECYTNATLFGLGSYDPLELYNTFSSKAQGIGLNNPSCYKNDIVDGYLDKALTALSQAEAYEYWKKAQWDGSTGFSNKGDAPWVWLVNLDHLFLMREGLEIGPQRIQPHGHDWPLIEFLENWHWKEIKE